LENTKQSNGGIQFNVKYVLNIKIVKDNYYFFRNLQLFYKILLFTKIKMSEKSQKTSVILIVFNGFLYHIHIYTVTVSYRRST
jgi:hypothetical protein